METCFDRAPAWPAAAVAASGRAGHQDHRLVSQPRGGPQPARSTPGIQSSGCRIGGQQSGHRRVPIVPRLFAPRLIAPRLIAPRLIAQGGLLTQVGDALGQPGEQGDNTVKEGGGDHECEHI